MEDKLINLLNQHSFFSNQDFGEYEISSERIGVMPKDVIYKIYKRRKNTSKLITEKLINDINDFQGSTILLTRITYNKKEFIVMTDDNMNHLIGVIKTVTY